MVLTKQILEEMAAVEIDNVDINELTELSDIEIDTSKPVIKKLSELASQTNNIYISRYQDYIVKVVHQKTGATIDDKMYEYLRRLAEVYY